MAFDCQVVALAWQEMLYCPAEEEFDKWWLPPQEEDGVVVAGKGGKRNVGQGRMVHATGPDGRRAHAGIQDFVVLVTDAPDFNKGQAR